MLKKLYILSLIGLYTCGVVHAEDEPADTAVWNKDPLGLETVVVTATRTPKTLKDIPVVTRVITAEDIRKVDATNMKDMLQQELPGLEFTYSMGQQVLNMGGYDGNNILFLVDGERMAGESMDNIDFSRLNLSSVARIEIVKGAASTLYGSSAMGGVINIITKDPSSTWAANVNTRYEGATKEWRHGASADFNMGKVNSLTTFQMTDADALHLGEDSSLYPPMAANLTMPRSALSGRCRML
ncbi:MAG: TonB-dependent receptor [Bacteroidaceae bacterium]|nr:TonB-dependent receptor [Bacteroidaceae bacterium]